MHYIINNDVACIQILEFTDNSGICQKNLTHAQLAGTRKTGYEASVNYESTLAITFYQIQLFYTLATALYSSKSASSVSCQCYLVCGIGA